VFHRRNFLALSISLIQAPFARVLAQEPKLETRSISVAVGGRAFLQYAPLAIAERLGFFRDAGLDVEIFDLRRIESAAGSHGWKC